MFRHEHLVIAALHDVLLEADWVFDVHIVLHLLGGQPLQLCVEFCHAVLREKSATYIDEYSKVEYLGE